MNRNRRTLVGGNWKMHLLADDAQRFCRSLTEQQHKSPAEVVLFPSFPLIPTVLQETKGGVFAVGGQDLHPEDQGAHTGDVSGAQLQELGCSWVLCGHSERRQDHGETDEMVGRKAAAAIRHRLAPLICIGETQEERATNRTFEVLERQMSHALASRPEPSALAYEPLWAIGTGKTATPELAQETHSFLRQLLADLLGEEAAGSKRILYGGSVNPANAAELIAQKDIDGFLVGGASLDPQKFSAIIRSCGLAA